MPEDGGERSFSHTESELLSIASVLIGHSGDRRASEVLSILGRLDDRNHVDASPPDARNGGKIRGISLSAALVAHSTPLCRQRRFVCGAIVHSADPALERDWQSPSNYVAKY